MEDDETVAVVIDNGSCMCKAGFSGDDAPKSVISSVVGRPKYGGTLLPGLVRRDAYVGDEAQRSRGILAIKYPIERGIVTDWDDMVKVCEHVFRNELRISPDDQPVFMSDSPLNPLANREKMTEIMMEMYNTPGFYVCHQSLMSLFSSGYLYGIAVDSGDGVTQVIPMEGLYTIKSAIGRLDLAGRDVTSYLSKLLMQGGCSLTTSSGFEIVRDIKEKLCYTALDFQQEVKTAAESSQLEESYELPDGQVIVLNDERFRSVEAMFQPSLIGVESDGVHKLVFESLMKCDIDLRRNFYSKIVLSGGSTMFQNFGDRLNNEISALLPGNKRPNVMAMPERKYSAWIGGSVITSLSTFQENWITKEDYEEHGPYIVHKKCLP